MFSPVQDLVTLICSTEERYVIDWRIAFANGEESFASRRPSLMFLLQRGFVLEGVATNRSILSLRETEAQTNNATNITCVANEEASTSETSGNTVQVIFYGEAN